MVTRAPRGNERGMHGEPQAHCQMQPDQKQSTCWSEGRRLLPYTVLASSISMLTFITYSISKCGHRCIPSFVPFSITHVPRRRARVSTIHRYRVGRAIGKRVLVQGRPSMNWYARDHRSSRKGTAQIRMRPMYTPSLSSRTMVNPFFKTMARTAWPASRAYFQTSFFFSYRK